VQPAEAKRLREFLRLSQRRVAVLSHMSQAAISLMEAGKQPIERQYERWLQQRVYGKYGYIVDMPTRVLRQAIRNRVEM
jgi:transcriptional regulator with XRE-family HTH domain